MIIPDKIKKEYRLKLEELIDYSFDKSLFIEENLLRQICFISSKTGYEVALLIDRKGRVIDLSVGDKSSAALSVERSNNRLNGLRVIHTHPNASSTLSNMDLSFLKNNNMDCVAAVSIKDDKPYDMQVGFLNGDAVSVVNCHNADYVNKYGLIEKIYESDKAYKEYYSN